MPQFLSNTYLVGDARRREAFFVDAGGPVEPLFAAAERHELTPTHVLLTHHHHDHVAELGAARSSAGPTSQVLAHPDEAALDERDRRRCTPGETVARRRPRGRAAAHAGPHRGDARAARRGQRLHRRHAVQELGRRRARARATRPTPTSSHSIMDVLLALPPETVIRPGHTEPTTVADEWEHNAFVRVWRGLDPEGDEPCTALGEPATLVLLGDDYDGGHKAWVRWPDGRDDIVPGSQVQSDGRDARRLASSRGRRQASRPRAWRARRTVGRLAAGQAARQAGTRAANLTRDEEAAAGRARRAASSRPPSRSSPRWGR